MAQRKENIVIFPFMAQGHIIPLLALALKLEQKKGYTITFVSTPLNIKRLRPSLPPNSSIRLLEIPFCISDHDLPSDGDNTTNLPPHLFVKLFEASLSLKPAFRKVIFDLVDEQDGHPPLCIISDIFLTWSADVAHEFGLFHAIFSLTCGFSVGCYYSICLHQPHLKTQSEEFTLPDFPEASKIHITQLSESLTVADGTESFSKYLKKVFPELLKTDGILVNSVDELDKIGLMHFRKKFLGKPVWPIGPLLLPTAGGSTRAGIEAGITPDLCKNWLDMKPPKSVLYISFGSQNTLSASQMMQLAMALDASGKNFIWVVRPPIGYDTNSEFKVQEWLPEGFEERLIKGSRRGLLVKKWAPQVEILSHKSVSAFLSHGGWNSVLESLSHGIPIIGWPMASEQFFNVKLIEEEIGVCVEMARGKSCEVRHEDIVKKIELVMNETEKGKEMRRKAIEVREILNNAMRDAEGYKGNSIKAIDEFLNAAELMRRRQRGGQTNLI